MGTRLRTQLPLTAGLVLLERVPLGAVAPEVMALACLAQPLAALVAPHLRVVAIAQVASLRRVRHCVVACRAPIIMSDSPCHALADPPTHAATLLHPAPRWR